MLAVVNSSAVGLAARVESVYHALVLLGVERVRQLATLVTMANRSRGNEEVLLLAATRAGMAKSLIDDPELSNAAYTAALISVLDVLFQVPMEELLAELPLADVVKDGLLDGTGPIGELLQAIDAYELVSDGAPSLGILLEYPTVDKKPDAEVRRTSVELPKPTTAPTKGAASIGFIGSGNYATAVLIPAFKESGARLRTVASSGGVSGLHAGRKFGFESTTTDTDGVFRDESVNTIVISTRHDSHASMVCQALRAGKHVFVEKPIALKTEELREIEAARADAAKKGVRPIVMVGFNRRFAPQVAKLKSLLRGAAGPKSFIMTVNAGAIPAEHWTQDRDVGGGRIVGEGCHFIDLLRFLAGERITSVRAHAMEAKSGDTVSIDLGFADGSIGTVHYFANGSKSFPKERIEVFAQGRVIQLDNFRKMTGFGWPKFSKMNLWRQDKGQKACAAAFVDAIASGGASPIPFEELIEVAEATIAAADLARTSR
jgi:predicted dehydrogenase